MWLRTWRDVPEKKRHHLVTTLAPKGCVRFPPHKQPPTTPALPNFGTAPMASSTKLQNMLWRPQLSCILSGHRAFEQHRRQHYCVHTCSKARGARMVIARAPARKQEKATWQVACAFAKTQATNTRSLHMYLLDITKVSCGMSHGHLMESKLWACTHTATCESHAHVLGHAKEAGAIDASAVAQKRLATIVSPTPCPQHLFASRQGCRGCGWCATCFPSIPSR